MRWSRWTQHMVRTFSNNSRIVAVTIFIIVLVIYFRRKILELLYKKDTWALVAMFHCFIMLSGHIWNKIRNPAFSINTKDGPVLFSNEQRAQFLAESLIVAISNGVAALGLILIIEAAGGVRETGVDRRRERNKPFQMFLGLALLLGSYSVILFAFTVKRPWYPYSL